MLRSGKQGGVYCSPPEKWGVRAPPRLECFPNSPHPLTPRRWQHRHVVMDLLTAPWVFPWRSPLLPYCSSARKVSGPSSRRLTFSSIH